jgi:hypothetical protein
MARLFIWFVAAAGLAAAHLGAAQEIHPPFGLRWGEGQKEVEETIGRRGARIVDQSLVAGRDSWTVDGFIQPALQRTLLYFGTDKALVEVELQYQQPEWDRPAYEDFFNSARQRLEARYGHATVLAEDKTPEGDVMQTLSGYEWQQESGHIQLFLFSAEREKQLYESVSVHYRAGGYN